MNTAAQRGHHFEIQGERSPPFWADDAALFAQAAPLHPMWIAALRPTESFHVFQLNEAEARSILQQFKDFVRQHPDVLDKQHVTGYVLGSRFSIHYSYRSSFERQITFFTTALEDAHAPAP